MLGCHPRKPRHRDWSRLGLWRWDGWRRSPLQDRRGWRRNPPKGSLEAAEAPLEICWVWGRSLSQNRSRERWSSPQVWDQLQRQLRAWDQWQRNPRRFQGLRMHNWLSWGAVNPLEGSRAVCIFGPRDTAASSILGPISPDPAIKESAPSLLTQDIMSKVSHGRKSHMCIGNPLSVVSCAPPSQYVYGKSWINIWEEPGRIPEYTKGPASWTLKELSQLMTKDLHLSI